MTVEVRPEPILERWEVTQLGITIAMFDTKDPAVQEARRLAKKNGAELRVYRIDHTLEEQHKYARNNGW